MSSAAVLGDDEERTSTAAQGEVESPDRRAQTGRRPRGLWAATLGLAVIAVVLGVLIRLWMLVRTPVNADNAVVGMMAEDILDGDFYAFYFGQAYGGVEPYAVAALSWLLPNDAFLVNATPSFLAGVAALLVWRIGAALSGSSAVGALAGVLAWIWPEVNLWGSTKASGFRSVTIVCGLLVLLSAIRIVRDEDRPRTWLALGLAGGVGLWSSPEILYFALPCGAVVLWVTLRDLRRRAKHVGLAALGAFVGMLPSLSWNVRHDFLSLRPTGTANGSTYAERAETFFAKVLPMLLGLRLEGSGDWLGGRSVGLALYAVLLVGLVAAAAVVVRRVPHARVVVLCAGLFPFVYAAFPPTWFWNDARYGVYLPPLLALVVVAACASFGDGRRLPALVVAVLLVPATVSTVLSFDRTFGRPLDRPSELADFNHEPNALASETVVALEQIGVTHAYADYWVAEVLSYFGDGAVVVDSLGQVRRMPASRAVGASPRPAWLFPDEPPVAVAMVQFQRPSFDPPMARLTSYLDAQGIDYAVERAGAVLVVRPEADVTPEDVGIVRFFGANEAVAD